MPLVYRTLRSRAFVLAFFTSSVWLGGCGASSKESYAPASPAYYGGGAAPAEQSVSAEPMPSMPSPAPPMMDSPSSRGSYEESESVEVSAESDESGFFGGSGGAESKASATALGPPPAPMAPGARAPMAAPPAKPTAPPATANNKPAQQPPGQPGKKTEGPSEAKEEKTVAPLLIYTGGLGMEVVDAPAIPTTIDLIIDKAESFGGYLASRSDQSVTVRIPSKHFRDALTAFEKLGEVKRRNVSAEDVSEQFHDLEVRLANLKTVQKRLQEFLAKAVNVNDALTVERELERVGREIDQIEGRMRFLRARATFSTITVDLSAKPKPQVIASGTTPPPPPRAIDLPIDWLSRVGLETLLNLR